MDYIKIIDKILWKTRSKAAIKIVDLYVKRHHQDFRSNTILNFREIAEIAYYFGRLAGKKEAENGNKKVH